MKNIYYYLLFSFALFAASCNTSDGIRLTSGMTISKSVVIAPDTYIINASEDGKTPILTIEGDNIVVDFNGAVLQGNTEIDKPDAFWGLGILIKRGKNITIKNLTVKGYKFGLKGLNVDSLTIENADFSYNYRPQISEITAKKSLFSSANQPNFETEWLKYGAAIHLKECNNALVKSLKITQGMNGLMLDNCNNGLFYNNTIQFNSGVGIGLYRSNENRVIYNKLDWNIHKIAFDEGEVNHHSAGILVHELSNKNTFAYNSATHSGYGISITAGKFTEDSGEGGCNDNLIYGNDFSYSPFAGIKTALSHNRIYNNSMVECKTGIQGRYTYKSEIIGNIIQSCATAIDFQNGQNNTIRNNDLYENEVGIRLWAQNDRPNHWGFSLNRDISSQEYAIDHNAFNKNKLPFQISNSENIYIVANDLYDFENVINAISNKNLIQKNNNLSLDKVELKQSTATFAFAPAPIEDGMNAMLPGSQKKGQQYILIEKYGVYDFQYPIMWLRTIEENRYVFALFAPLGNWKLTSAEGLDRISLKTGTFPSTVVVNRSEGADLMKVELDFIGNEITTPFGEVIEKGAGFVFGY
jgi:parallel beta-helix repeat protein